MYLRTRRDVEKGQRACSFSLWAWGALLEGSEGPAEGLPDSSLFVLQNECFFASEAPGRGLSDSSLVCTSKRVFFCLRSSGAREPGFSVGSL